MEKQIADQRKDTIAIMISVGDRTRLTDYTFKRLTNWASSHGYSSLLIKKDINDLDRTPHFIKLIAHRVAPGFKRYIIVDDDLLIKYGASAMEDVPAGMVGLCPDAIQSSTQVAYVKWTANTGFIVADESALALLEEAYQNGEYPYNIWDGSNKGIWGPHDQAALNDVLFKKDAAYMLDWRWNYQAVIKFYTEDKNGWEKWKVSRIYRVSYYLSLLIPFSKRKRLLNECYGVHMTMGVYPKFFNFILGR